MLPFVTNIANAEFLFGISHLTIKFYKWENKIYFRMIHFLTKFQVLPNNPERKLLALKKITSSVSYKCKMIGQGKSFFYHSGEKEFINGRMGESLDLK